MIWLFVIGFVLLIAVSLTDGFQAGNGGQGKVAIIIVIILAVIALAMLAQRH